VILKMHLTAKLPAEGGAPRAARPAFALVTLLPLAWLLSVTMTAGVQKVFHPDPRIGFLAQAATLDKALPGLQDKLALARNGGDALAVTATEKEMRTNRTLRFNNRLDAVVAGVFLALVAGIVLLSVTEWVLLLARRRGANLHESAAVWLPDYAVAEAKPLKLGGLLALALGLARELSDEAAVERAKQSAQLCPCGCAAGVSLLAANSAGPASASPNVAYREVLERRFGGRMNRCC
jgi:carbon starvation protein